MTTLALRLLVLFHLFFSSLQMTTNAYRPTASSSLSTSNDISIVRVDFNQNESPLLRQGVVDLFQLYFQELFHVGCDLGFQGFQNEWKDLPGKYDFHQRGGLFLAIHQPLSAAALNDYNNNDTINKEQIVGCIALRPLTETCAEIKRMFIRESWRKQGIGYMLAHTIVNHAWDEGYTEIKLDSLERLEGAVQLYQKLGFTRIPPYCECPEADHVCMNLYKLTHSE